MLLLTVGFSSLLWRTLLFIGAPIHPSTRLNHAMPDTRGGGRGVHSSGSPTIAILAGLGTGSLAGHIYSRVYSVPPDMFPFEERISDHWTRQLASLFWLNPSNNALPVHLNPSVSHSIENAATDGHPFPRTSHWDSSADVPGSHTFLTPPISHRLEHHSTHGFCANPLPPRPTASSAVPDDEHPARNPTYLTSPISHRLQNNSSHGSCTNPLSRPIGWSATLSPNSRSARNPAYLTLTISHHLENNSTHGFCAEPLSSLMGRFARTLTDGHSERMQTAISPYPEMIDPESLTSDSSNFVHGSATITYEPATTVFEFELRVRVVLPTFVASFNSHWQPALLRPSIATLWLSKCRGFLRRAFCRAFSWLRQTLQQNSFIAFRHDIQRVAPQTLASLVPEGGLALEDFPELRIPSVVARRLLGVGCSILSNTISTADHLINLKGIQEIYIPALPHEASPSTLATARTFVNQLRTKSGMVRSLAGHLYGMSRVAVTALAKRYLECTKVAAGYVFLGAILLLAILCLVSMLGINVVWLLSPRRTSSAQGKHQGDDHAAQASKLHNPPTPEVRPTASNTPARRGPPATSQRTPPLPRGPAKYAYSPLTPSPLATVTTAGDLAFFTDNIPITSTPPSFLRFRYPMKPDTNAVDNVKAQARTALESIFVGSTSTDTLDEDLSVCTEASYYAVDDGKYNTRKIISYNGLSRVRVIEHKDTGGKLTMKTTKRLEETITTFLQEVQVMTLLSSSIWCQTLLGTSATEFTIDMYFNHHKQGNLGAYLFRRGGCLDRTLSIFYLAELLLSLHEIHMMGIAHGEVALHNILLTDNRHLTLSNFSSARAFEQIGEGQELDHSVASVAQGREYGVEATHHYSLDYLDMAKVYHHMLTSCRPSYDISPIRFRDPPTLRALPEHRQVFREDDLSFFEQVMKGFPEGSSGWLEMRHHPIFHAFDWEAMNKQLVPVPAPRCVLTRDG